MVNNQRLVLSQDNNGGKLVSTDSKTQVGTGLDAGSIPAASTKHKGETDDGK